MGAETDGTVGAGSIADFRVEFTPRSQDQRFGIFQVYVGGLAIGDGSTTALHPHYRDFQRLCDLAQKPGVRERERLILGDTFDHLDLNWRLTNADVFFTFTTRPAHVWGDPPPWAPAPGVWARVKVARSTFISTWRAAQPQFFQLMGLQG
ncbi:hypothetical protein EV385_5538 [Krasilnikovia cinnamomea]|uniref:Uncharacterized protein n=1 Tax=Krasilnikovia cinnamomea TaxID=349313 RepID=A0A4Q7ZR49_9ACTN|nr:hypothetical protein [Krasilnikovia cinnamomea]RZU53607.1 hypothetical protein EV385_5538 [Krasilnikovia cinnamomea]